MYLDFSSSCTYCTTEVFLSLDFEFELMQEEGASNLAPHLQAQIDETLEEINPRCVLELLALPLGDDCQAKRAEGLQGVRNILWAVGGGGAAAVAGGFTREDFMNEAFQNMTAAEQVFHFLFFFYLLPFLVEKYYCNIVLSAYQRYHDSSPRINILFV